MAGTGEWDAGPKPARLFDVGSLAALVSGERGCRQNSSRYGREAAMLEVVEPVRVRSALFSMIEKTRQSGLPGVESLYGATAASSSSDDTPRNLGNVLGVPRSRHRRTLR